MHARPYVRTSTKLVAHGSLWIVAKYFHAKHPNLECAARLVQHKIYVLCLSLSIHKVRTSRRRIARRWSKFVEARMAADVRRQGKGSSIIKLKSKQSKWGKRIGLHCDSWRMIERNLTWKTWRWLRTQSLNLGTGEEATGIKSRPTVQR